VRRCACAAACKRVAPCVSNATLSPPPSHAAARDASPPDWRALPRLSFSELMSALRAGGRTVSAEVWVDRDPGVYWPPPPLHQPFQGKRALLRFQDGTQAWAELPIPELEVRAAVG
jgi:hypothetical protein